MNRLYKWLPLVFAALIAAGIWIGYILAGGNNLTTERKKLNTVFDIIEEEYVDEIDLDSLVEATIPHILRNLDPHTTYIPRDELERVNSELDRSFSGIGIQFQMLNDTVCVIEVISGGPSESAGLHAGDRIIAVDSVDIAGKKMTMDAVASKIRGPKGSEVKLTVKRINTPDPLQFVIVRGDIPVTSVDAKYMLNDSVGYVKVGKFARNTYPEFLQAIGDLRYHGATNIVIDLRGNTGGYMEPAIFMANEFLAPGLNIVETRGRRTSDNSMVLADGSGAFGEMGLVVLVDEFTASSSEIFSGAIQDNDRGLIVGRRTFGKGLVQRPVMLPDSSEIRLTVQRYYTPSGRCIQKDFDRKNIDSYEEEIVERYNRGEIFTADSMRLKRDSVYHTDNGREVYGGGGIIPDLFVPSDTSGVSTYYINVSNAGLLNRFAYETADLNREQFSKARNVSELLKLLPSDSNLLYSFVRYAVQHGIAARPYYINISSSLIVNQLKALIARDILGMNAFYEIYNAEDSCVKEALKLIADGETATPVSFSGTSKKSQGK